MALHRSDFIKFTYLPFNSHQIYLDSMKQYYLLSLKHANGIFSIHYAMKHGVDSINLRRNKAFLLVAANHMTPIRVLYFSITMLKFVNYIGKLLLMTSALGILSIVNL